LFNFNVTLLINPNFSLCIFRMKSFWIYSFRSFCVFNQTKSPTLTFMDSLALTLIKKNLETKDPFLDLGNCGLRGDESELELLRECEHLETMVFSNAWREYDEKNREWLIKNSKNKLGKNKISQLTDSIPSSLRELFLAENLLEDYSVLSRFKSLNRLNLSFDGGETITEHFMKSLFELKELYIYRSRSVFQNLICPRFNNCKN